MRTSDFTDYFVLRRFLAEPWAFLRRRNNPSPDPIFEVPLKDGAVVRMRTATHDRHVFHRIFARDQYRLNDVPPGSYDTVIDIGAHIGGFALRAAPLARKVYAYEPTPDTYALLAQNLSAYPHVKTFAQAVAGQVGTMTLHIGVSPDRNTLFMHDPRSSSSVTVPTTTLQEVFRQNDIARCDLLKLDCEGAEYEILYNAPDELWSRIHKTCIEYHPVEPARKGWSGPELAEFLKGKGHRVELLPPSRKGHSYIFSERG